MVTHFFLHVAPELEMRRCMIFVHRVKVVYTKIILCSLSGFGDRKTFTDRINPAGMLLLPKNGKRHSCTILNALSFYHYPVPMKQRCSDLEGLLWQVVFSGYAGPRVDLAI